MRATLRLASLVVLVIAASAGPGCTSSPATGPADNSGPQFNGGGGIGAACSRESPCRSGLTCGADGFCAVGHSSPAGASCTLNDECANGLYCSEIHVCAARPGGASGGDVGASCKSDGDCKDGLRCALDGLSATCAAEGKGDVGATCTLGTDCYGGLACVDGKCGQAAAGIPPFGYSMWAGETCGTDTPNLAYFRVPRGSDDGDFYRLPFPNDVRLKNGHPDFSGHPTPGADLLGFDAVERYIQALEQGADGWGAYPTVIFRFGSGVDLPSLQAQGVVSYVDITKSAMDTYGQEQGYGWFAYGGRGKYVCSNWLGVRPPQGSPLTPGHTYAILITRGPKIIGGDAFQPDDDFAALVGATQPADAALASAWTTYQPLRDYLKDKSIDPATLLVGSMFTVGHVRTPAQKLVEAVEAMPPPMTSGWMRCGDGTDPCPDTTNDRACGAADPSFDELHALVSLPIFQTGTPPYAKPEDGGGIDVSGTPAPVRTEQVCLSLTVPKGATMPASGWPVVVYAHGTGGSFRSSVTEGVAAMLASAAPSPMAVLSIDQVEHGPRRGSSTASPNELFFNFANPAAALGNPLQGAVDQISLARLAATMKLDGSSSPTGAPIAFDPKAILFWGHSQGATEGGISVPYSKDIAGAVLSGEGASLIDSLLTKTSPVNIAAAVPFALQDPDPQDPTKIVGGTYHPVLNILQMYIDPADPLNHAIVMTDQPPMGVPPHHVFQPYGVGDTYATPRTEATYALAAQLELVGPDLVSTPGEVPGPCMQSSDTVCTSMGATPPVSGNKTIGGAKLTAVVREYQPDGTYDGHFVAVKNATARTDVARFLSQLAAGMVPQVGP